jgi:hypothetical protein
MPKGTEFNKDNITKVVSVLVVAAVAGLLIYVAYPLLIVAVAAWAGVVAARKVGLLKCSGKKDE